MKKLFFFAIILLCVQFSNAQNAIPNAGFETWNVNPNYDDPAGWGTINGLTYFLGVRTVTKATAVGEYHGGSAAIKLESKTVPLQGVAPGIAATGTINPNTQAVDGGVAYNKRPISFTGWYRYQPNGVDTGSIDARLSKWNSNTQQREDVGSAEFVITSTVNSYAQFTVNFTYTSANFPDTLVITLLTSSGANSSPNGTKMWVDDLDFVLCSPNYSAIATTTSSTCTANNGSATVNASNGTNPYSFLWSNNGNTNQITNIVGGTYTVTVTDGNGCTVTTTATVNANSNPLTVTASSTQSSCISNTGSVTASSSNGAPNFTYAWSNDSTTSTVSNIGAGTYSVTITDSNGCSGTGTTSVTTPNGPSAIGAATDVLCNGGLTGAVNVTATGGTGNLSFLWSNGVTTEDISNLPTGNYCVTITDANNCSFQLCTPVAEPDTFSFDNLFITNVSCFGGNDGSVTLNVTGGTFPYSFGNPTSNLIAGAYSITVTDANTCSASISVSITQPTVLTLTLTATDASSSTATDGYINSFVSGGTPTYSYVWSPTVFTPNLTGFPPSWYCLTVTDANSCIVTACATISAPSAINNISDEAIKLYPNPASNKIVIETSSSTDKFTFSIYSLEGKLVEEKSISGESVAVDVKQLSVGLYSYQLKNSSSGKVSYGKLQIQR